MKQPQRGERREIDNKLDGENLKKIIEKICAEQSRVEYVSF